VAAKSGDQITGTIAVTYKDISKVDLQIAVLETRVVLYTFKATRLF
jgi:hypothetical protein